MRQLLILLVFLATACSGPQNNQSQFYIGTYTDNGSEGIYSATFDAESGIISTPVLSAETENPSYITFTRDGLVAVNETLAGSDDGGVTRFEINPDFSLTPIETVSSNGLYPCYVSYVEDEDAILIANYGTGNVVSYTLQDGSFTVASNIKVEGSGPNSSRQEGPHAHFIQQHRNDFVYAVDLGADKVSIFSINNGSLELRGEYMAQPGDGPRHMSFHPTLPVAYLISELSSTITVLGIEPDGMLETRQRVSTLPEDWNGQSYCADIHVHPNGKLLFGSNRGHDSIVSFEIDADGMLKSSKFFDDDVDWPRNFSVAPDGRHLLIANQKGNTIVVAEIDLEQGLMSKKSMIEVASPVCIQFE